ncbi:WD40-repeat-containing domain protein [Dunaliella salina]|uniref:WD40-repeat-containing domain protein n=1 Tax=Dunaliella salina TaxID=3046 RepID=A0ABQ7GYN9_DUNSA|nr:WD40-repeat-containing domain protein [Dunaliella salina]|eukprot:KAF5839713.1 WD40-repeat-containing domain protein [Dunaliella salina]
MDPGIEIWDLDIIDAVEPAATLGGVDEAAAEAAFTEAKEAAGGKLDKAKKKVGKLRSTTKDVSDIARQRMEVACGFWWKHHTDKKNEACSRLCMLMQVWDVARQTAEHTFKHHTDKVQAVAWNPAETPVLLTGGFDKLAALVDVRTPATQPAKWQLSADVESVLWSPHDPTHFLISSEDGLVAVYDARKGAGSAPVFRLAAHDKPTCAMSFCPAAPGLLATAATDKKTKLWDISSGAPVLLATQDLQVGAVFTMGFSADAPHLLAVGGAMGSVVVWDVRANQDVTRRFPQLLPQQPLAS